MASMDVYRMLSILYFSSCSALHFAISFPFSLKSDICSLSIIHEVYKSWCHAPRCERTNDMAVSDIFPPHLLLSSITTTRHTHENSIVFSSGIPEIWETGDNKHWCRFKMTTYAGRSAGYVPGKEVVNKEPPVSKYVVEKLYRVHRERVNNMPSTIDSHVKIPDFLKNQTWKKSVERQRQERISQANQEIYDRISKLENKESGYRVEQKLHVKRIEAKSAYLKRLKEHGRLIQLLKIQKENEYLLRRIERAKPEYTKKKCDNWYKHHELFKAGR